jgi:hypothetical protein
MAQIKKKVFVNMSMRFLRGERGINDRGVIDRGMK